MQRETLLLGIDLCLSILNTEEDYGANPRAQNLACTRQIARLLDKSMKKSLWQRSQSPWLRGLLLVEQDHARVKVHVASLDKELPVARVDLISQPQDKNNGSSEEAHEKCLGSRGGAVRGLSYMLASFDYQGTGKYLHRGKSKTWQEEQRG